MGFVMTWTQAPASPDATKKSVGVRLALDDDSDVSLISTSEIGAGDFKVAIARSMRDLKKKKDAQLVAFPSMFGIRPRYTAVTGRSAWRSPLMTAFAVIGVDVEEAVLL